MLFRFKKKLFDKNIKIDHKKLKKRVENNKYT
jgi:hypothetical protein